MFVGKTRGAQTRDGEPRVSGKYLVLFSDDENHLYGAVRHVTLEPLGNFMMGFARIGDEKISVSGAYGQDGLPKDINKLSENAKSHLVPVPHDLEDKFWKGGGHNSPGTEADDMARWAHTLVEGHESRSQSPHAIRHRKHGKGWRRSKL